MLRSALRVVDDGGNPGRANQFSGSIRPLFEHLLESFAPKKKVEQCSWFRIKTKNGLPTRMQRAIYATQGGLSDAYVRSDLGLNPKVLHRPVIRAIDRLAKSIHVRPETLIEDKKRIRALVEESLEALETLFVVIQDCRGRLQLALEDRITRATVEGLISEAIDEVDVLATHHWINGEWIENIAISINHDTVEFQVNGSIDVVLQWGSASDNRRGQGASDEDSFPFSCSLSSPTDDPESIELDFASLQVDTSEYYAE
jgi:hypothetical protein